MRAVGCNAQYSKPQLHDGRANTDGGAPLDFGVPAVVVSEAN